MKGSECTHLFKGKFELLRLYSSSYIQLHPDNKTRELVEPVVCGSANYQYSLNLTLTL